MKCVILHNATFILELKNILLRKDEYELVLTKSCFFSIEEGGCLILGRFLFFLATDGENKLCDL